MTDLDCTLCGGTGYVLAAYSWLDCTSTDHFKPTEPNMVVRCACNQPWPFQADRYSGDER